MHPGEHVIPAWFTDARFGIFIHGGVCSAPARAPVQPRIYAEWYWFFQQLPIFQQYHCHLLTYGAERPQFREARTPP